MMSLYNINEFSKKIGVSTSTLRYWDKSGFLSPCCKTAGGHRRYSEEQALSYLNSDDNRFNTTNICINITGNDIVSITGTYSLSDNQKAMIQNFVKNIL